VLGACWSKTFWVSFGNLVGPNPVTSQQRSSVHEIQLVYIKELARTRWMLVRIFGTLFSSYNGLHPNVYV
jgi:hypothetical protein